LSFARAVCAGLLAAACVSPGAYQAEVARQRALATDLTSCKQGMLDASRGREKLLVEKSALDAERAALVKQVESERAGVSALHEALEKERVARAIKDDAIDRMGLTAQLLRDSLKSELAAGQLEIEQEGDRLRIRAVDKLLFDPSSAELKAPGKAALARIAAGIKGASDSDIRVEGHTDASPIKSARFGSNWELSAARAAAVVRSLVAAGVPANHLAAVGYGENRPIAANDSAEGRARNRRIEILLVPYPAE